MPTKKSRKIYKGRIVDLRVEQHQLPNGHQGDYEIVSHIPAAAVLPVVGNQIILIHQYRVPLKKYIWEIPAGLMEKGESPLECIRREMIEETGFYGKNFKKMGSIYTGAGFCDEIIHIYQCRVGREVGTAHESTEDISVHFFPAEKIKKMLKKGEIPDAKTAYALLHYFNFST